MARFRGIRWAVTPAGGSTTVEHISFRNELLSNYWFGDYVGSAHELCRHVGNGHVSEVLLFLQPEMSDADVLCLDGCRFALY